MDMMGRIRRLHGLLIACIRSEVDGALSGRRRVTPTPLCHRTEAVGRRLQHKGC